MANEASILVTLRDQYSPNVQRMRDANSGFGRSMEEIRQKAQAYQTRLEGLVKQQAQLQTKLVDAKKALKDAEKAYKETADEANAEALTQAREKYEALNVVLRETNDASRETQNSLRELGNQGQRSEGLFSALGKAGLINMAGDVAGQWAQFGVGSAFGEDVGSVFGGALSGAASGAALGSLLGPVGTAVGAALGGIIGAAGSAAEIAEKKDDAFIDYYTGLYDNTKETREDAHSGGRDTAAQREIDAIAFNRMLGAGVGDQYLEDLRKTAAATPMEYEDLTAMSQALAPGFKNSPERMLELMTAIGDAGSAVGGTASDMSVMAQSMSRMQSSGKATLEYLNIFQDRGVDVIGMLAEAMGKTQGQIYNMISKGQISGQSAVDIIQAGMVENFGGAMETMASTTQGLTSTLADAMTEIENAYGEGYNERRNQGMSAEIEDYGGLLGEVMQNVNRIAGENAAYMENLKEQYKREALSAVLLGEATSYIFSSEDQAQLQAMRKEFSEASAQYEATGSQEAALKMEALTTTAEAMAQAAYEASDQYQMMQDAEADSLEALRDNTSALEAATNAYSLSQERTKGTAARQNYWGPGSGRYDARMDPSSSEYDPAYAFTGYATGLERVPYNNFPALLHEGERVLTAREARNYARGGGSGGIQITMNGTVIREEADIDQVAQRLLDKILAAKTAGVYGA